ncbi:MAG: hypothetical protein WB919_19580 [Candidatus Sulfotelmatobacter sp.]
MNDLVGWIAAEADGGDLGNANRGLTSTPVKEKGRLEGGILGDVPPGDIALDDSAPCNASTRTVAWQNLPAHNFSAGAGAVSGARPECALDRNPDLWLYRKRTTALLRRYMRLSMETGRLPSVIGREFFRAKITSYTSATFEDRVIFVHDVETCLERLAPFDQGIIARVVLQEHDHERAARLLQCTRKTVERRLPELLDELSEELLSVGLLVRLPKAERPVTAKPF